MIRVLLALVLSLAQAVPTSARPLPSPHDATRGAAGAVATARSYGTVAEMAEAPADRRRAAPSAEPDVVAGYERAYQDLRYHFWDPVSPGPEGRALPRIRPTRGAQPGVGHVDNQAPKPSFWQMTMYANVIYQEWKRTGSPAVQARFRAQWAFIRSIYTDAQLQDATSATGIVNTSDDLSWAIDYLVQVHEVTGDERALTDAVGLFRNGRARFADSTRSGTGMLYTTANGDPEHQNMTTLFDAVIASSMLKVYRETNAANLLAYAKATYAWTRRYLKHPAGVYFIELDIGAASPTRLKPHGFDRPQDIRRGASVSYLAGTMAVAVLAARLYRITGDTQYLDEARDIAAGIAKPSTFLREVEGRMVLVNDRDGWSNGYFAPAFVAEVLALPGIDPNGVLRQAIADTARAIIVRRTGDGYYTPDWSGPERNASSVYGGDYDTWIQQGTATAKQGGSGSGIALPSQMMTSATSVSMIQAGAFLEAQARER